jgi:metal-sulfur cluster biosynthetic enzyme
VTIDPDILAALQDVVDPELGINIVDIGLVYRAIWTTAGIEVAITLTTPSCPFGEMLVEEARTALRSHFPETSSIHIELVWDPPWSLDRLSEQARRQLGWSKSIDPRPILDAGLRRRGIDQRLTLIDVVAYDAKKQRLITVVLRIERHVFLQVVRQAMQIVHDSLCLFLNRQQVRWQQTAQSKHISLLFRKSSTFVEERIAQQGKSARKIGSQVIRVHGTGHCHGLLVPSCIHQTIAFFRGSEVAHPRAQTNSASLTTYSRSSWRQRLIGSSVSRSPHRQTNSAICSGTPLGAA